MISINAAITQARAQATVDHLNTKQPLQMILYGGVQPSPGGAALDVPIATFPINSPVNNPNTGTWELLTPGTVQVTAPDGPHTVTWARLEGSTGWLLDLDAGAPGSGAALEVETTELYAGGFLVLANASLEG